MTSDFQLGIDRLLNEPELRAELRGRRLALLGHPASVTSSLKHSLDALSAHGDLNISAAFGPQHGMRGEKQDNMVETQDHIDPVYQIPVFSLYGEVRRPTDQMMSTFDVLLFDLQDIGSRLYTYATTLRYVLEAANTHQKSVWILDRPNPAGRPIEGLKLQAGFESFVGAAPIPQRHGLTLGELAVWFKKNLKLNLELKVITMLGYRPNQMPDFGWPNHLSWVNPSPNAPNLSMARCFPGTVMLEGTTLSEGRGTTRPLEIFGAPGLDARALLMTMQRFAPSWLKGCALRPCHFQPTFHKHSGEMCSGLQIHIDHNGYIHREFKPYRLMSLAFKSLRHLSPDFPLWRNFHYEYEKTRLAIDLINGTSSLREWVDNSEANPEDLERLLKVDEQAWEEERLGYLLYQD